MIFYADKTWSPLNANPFSTDGEYGEDWSAFIYDTAIDYYSNVLKNAKVYTLRVSPAIDTAYVRLRDFVKYELSYNRNVIIYMEESKRYQVREIIDNETLEGTTTVRETDSRWLVHSTTEELWEKIKETGALLSPSELKKRQIAVHEIGLKELLEPKDYSEYIMLDILNGCGEIVVNSRQLGHICLDSNIPYKPGVRLYFDAHRIIKDGLAARDGLHVLKVKNELPLNKYLENVVTDKLLPNNNIWTPTLYTECANKYFEDSIRR